MFEPLDHASIQRALAAYLSEPTWVHSPHVTPLIAWLSQGPSHWPATPLPDGAVDHLIWSLRAWSAFRGGGALGDKVENLRQHLPDLVSAVQSAVEKTQSNRLADVSPQALDGLADALNDAFSKAATAIKDNRSFVLPSKTAHLLFPSMIPAYDVEVVANTVMATLLPARMRGRTYYATWLGMCWWVLGQLRDAGELRKAGEQVRDSLLNSWTIQKLDPQRPSRDDVCLPLLDSYVAEYVLIGLARAGAELKPLQSGSLPE